MENACHPVLNCPLLRTAVYRNRTSSRALRHNIALSCVPVAMLPAVAPWLPPWDVVPPEAALRGLRSLEIVHRCPDVIPGDAPDPHELLQGLTVAMESVSQQLTNVRSLTLRVPMFPTGRSYLAGPAKLLVQRILRCLPALQSLALPNAAVLSSESRRPPQPVEVGAPGDRHIELTPRLTSLDTRDNTRSYVADEAQLLLHSLLCSRLSLRTLSTHSTAMISAIADEYLDNASESLPPRLADSQPSWKELSATDLQSIYAAAGTEGTVPAKCLDLHTPAWTLRSVTLEAENVFLTALSLKKMCRFVAACPALQFLKLSWVYHSCPPEWEADVSFTDPVQKGQLAACDAILRLAHAARDEHTALQRLSPTHASTLASIASEQAYPAALLFAFARGFELTTLQRVNVSGAVGARVGAVFDAAVEAARLMRRKELGRQGRRMDRLEN